MIYSGIKCNGVLISPLTIATTRDWGHELAHLADRVNKNTTSPHSRNTELLSTVAEYVLGLRWNEANPGTPYNVIFDAPLMYTPAYDPYPIGDPSHPYDHYRMFSAYLFQHFSAATDSNDLVYKWIRHKTWNIPDTSFRGLGEELNAAPYSSMISGNNAVEKFGNLFHRYAIAKYINSDSYADGIYGFGDVETNGSVGFHTFEWPDPLCQC